MTGDSDGLIDHAGDGPNSEDASHPRLRDANSYGHSRRQCSANNQAARWNPARRTPYPMRVPRHPARPTPRAPHTPGTPHPGHPAPARHTAAEAAAAPRLRVRGGFGSAYLARQVGQKFARERSVAFVVGDGAARKARYVAGRPASHAS